MTSRKSPSTTLRPRRRWPWTVAAVATATALAAAQRAYTKRHPKPTDETLSHTAQATPPADSHTGMTYEQHRQASWRAARGMPKRKPRKAPANEPL